MENISDNEMSNLSLNDSNDRSDSESTHSTPEDERIKRLFFTCDTNGDGFITYDDIRQVCIQLQMEYCVEEIMQELGTDANGRISYSDFVKRRSELLDIKKSDTSEDCESTISESKEPLLDESSQASSFEMSSVADEQAFGSHQSRSSMLRNDNRQQKVTNNETESSGLSNTEGWLLYKRHDSWEFDSGTHDLESDTISLHKQIEASGIEMPSNINELLDLANRYYIESINNIKQEKSRIHTQLKSILREHEFLQKQILTLKEEKISIIKDLEKKKLKECKEYEDKITELQSIIGELSQNLNYYQFLTIKEEEDEYAERDNEMSVQNTCGLNAVSNKYDSKESKSESNLNLKTEVIPKYIETQIQNELVLSETENVNNRKEVRYESHDSHATALEIDRLECRISNLETQIDLSALHLNQSKESAERLTVLLGKYDANNTALELALNYSDKALDITELLVSLLESEIGLVLANCRAAGLGKNEYLSEVEEKEEVMRIYESATHKRKLAEESALNYLKQNCCDFNLMSNTTFSREHENKLRDILNNLKDQKLIVTNSITKLEAFVEESEKEFDSLPESITKCQNLNIETIVLMQDLVSIKEMNASLRSQLYSLQKENSILVKQIMKLKENQKIKMNFEEWDPNKRKEWEYSPEYMIDLKKANGNLSEELERIKRKYLTKIKKLEQKIGTMSQKYSTQIKILQNKITILENPDSLRTCIETTL